MKRITDMGQMIDRSSGDLRLVGLVWAYNVHASAGMWQSVLKDKWMLVDYEQRG